MIRRILSLTLVICLLAAPVFAKSINIPDLMGDEAFAKAAPEQRLAMLNQQIADKKIQSHEVSGDIWARLFMDVLVGVKDPKARIEKYGQLRNQYPKTGTTYDLETTLCNDFLAVAKPKTILERIKMIQELSDRKIITWPTVAPLHRGLLSLHLSTDEKYLALGGMDKLIYIEKLAKDKYCSNLTTTGFAKGVANEMLSAAPPDKQGALFAEIVKVTDFFTKSAMERGYIK